MLSTIGNPPKLVASPTPNPAKIADLHPRPGQMLYPAVSLRGRASFNFGPDFKYPVPQGWRGKGRIFNEFSDAYHPPQKWTGTKPQKWRFGWGDDFPFQSSGYFQVQNVSFSGCSGFLVGKNIDQNFMSRNRQSWFEEIKLQNAWFNFQGCCKLVYHPLGGSSYQHQKASMN